MATGVATPSWRCSARRCSGRGVHDTVISETRIEQASAWLPTHSTLEERTYDTAHSITEGELADVATFMNANLERRVGPT